MRLPATSGVVTTAVALCLLATSALPLHGQAQAPAPAELARALQKRYAAVRDFRANFTQTASGGVLTMVTSEQRGEVKITVYFDIDSNGIVSVTAEETETGQAAAIRLEASTGLTAEEVADLRTDLDFDNIGF